MKNRSLPKPQLLIIIVLVFMGNPASRVYPETSSSPFLKGWAAYENKDFASALKHWQPLAEKGNPDAQYLLGIIYKNGYGVQVNFLEAEKWFRKSAGQGDVGAQYYLGVFMETGKGHPPDFKQAGFWFKKAAQQGYPDAQYRLGKWYSKENGEEHDFVLAYVWFALADANGIQTAKPKIEEIEQQLTSKQLTRARQLAHQVWVRLEGK